MDKDANHIFFLIEIPNQCYYEIKKFLKIHPQTEFNLDVVEIKNFFDKESYKGNATIFLCVAKTFDKNRKREIKIQMNIDNYNFEGKLNNFDFSRTLYLYNFYFEKKYNKNPPNINLLTFYQKFHIFLNYLKQNSNNFIYDKRLLIFDSLYILKINDQIEFDLVLELIRQCYRKKEIKDIIMHINKKNIKCIHRKTLKRKYYENIINGIVGKFKDNINVLFKYNEYKVKDLVLNKIALFFYRIFEPELVKKFFEKSNKKSDLINILFDNRLEIGIYNLESITFYLKFADTKDLCNKIYRCQKIV